MTDARTASFDETQCERSVVKNRHCRFVIIGALYWWTGLVSVRSHWLISTISIGWIGDIICFHVVAPSTSVEHGRIAASTTYFCETDFLADAFAVAADLRIEQNRTCVSTLFNHLSDVATAHLQRAAAAPPVTSAGPPHLLRVQDAKERRKRPYWRQQRGRRRWRLQRRRRHESPG